MSFSKAALDSRTIDAVLLRSLALEKRRDGWSFAKIAAYLKVSDITARNYVRDGLANLKAIADEDAEALRTLEAERMDLAIQSLVPSVKKGDVSAIQTMLKVSAEKRKLLGLDRQQEITEPTHVFRIIEGVDVNAL